MLANVLYILPMLLGRTYDARYDRVGFDIFPESELERAKILDEPDSISRYETTESSDEVRDLLEVSGDLALKVKAGKLDLKGTGTYLKDASKSGKNIEILTRLRFKTKTVALPPDVQPFPDWLVRFPPKELGTHFVRSITYGGELIASIRFRANKESNFKTVSGIIKGTFGGGEASSLVAEGKLELIQHRLKDQASMEISYYATVPLKGVPNTIEGLRQLIQNFNKHVQEVNDGWGVPIRVELMEMESLGGKNASQFRFLKNRALEAELTDLETEFDDLRMAQNRLTEWVRSLPASFVQGEVEEKIQKLYTRITKALRPYYDTIGKMNIEEGPDQLKGAREAYREGRLSALPGRYGREVDKLKKNTVVIETKLHSTGSSAYVRWGKKECPSSSPMLAKIHTGYVVTSTNRGTGGSSEYLCITDKPSFPRETELKGDDSSTFLSGARYGTMEASPYRKDLGLYLFGHGIPCSLCHLTNRTLTVMFPARDQCPSDEGGQTLWLHEYSGYLMAGSILPGTYICVDEEPEYYSEISEEKMTHSVTLAMIGKGTVPATSYEPNSAIKCVVCSM